MRILFVTNEIPYPPDNGCRIVSHHAMRLMKEAGHQLALAVLTEEADNTSERFCKIEPYLDNDMGYWMALPKRSPFGVMASALLRGTPYFVERYRNSEFREKLKRLVMDFKPDAIHFDIITMLQYKGVADESVRNIASINDSYALTLKNALSSGNYRYAEFLYRYLQFFQVLNYEKKVCSTFDCTHVMSGVDAEYLKGFNSDIRTAVIPNGVDRDLFDVAGSNDDKYSVIFVAKLEGENILCLSRFLALGWPIVRRSCPDLELHVVGRMGASAERLRDSLEKNSGVKFLGYADSLADVYRQCGIAIVPINKNCGIINKAIEAMASGLVVVGLSDTFSGIPQAKNGIHCIAVDDFVGMGKAVVELVENKDRCLSIRHSGHEMAREEYSWESRVENYQSMYSGAYPCE